MGLQFAYQVFRMHFKELNAKIKKIKNKKNPRLARGDVNTIIPCRENRNANKGECNREQMQAKRLES